VPPRHGDGAALAAGGMTGLADLADDALVDALLMEAAALLERLIDHGTPGSIDLGSLKLSESTLANLEQRLGRGEVTIQLDAAGQSEIRETAFAGIWWTCHSDEAGRVIARLIEIAFVPEMVRADIGDMKRGLQRLPHATHAAAYAAAQARRRRG
jgi:hydrogenase-1 operon protein HyaF